MTDRTAFVLLVAWVITAPVFLGSVAEAVPAPGPLGSFIGAGGGYALFRLLGAASAIALLPGLVCAGRRPAIGDRRSRVMLLLLLALPLLGLLQLVPLPRGLHGVIAPAHAADLELLLPGGGAAPISTDPGLTLNAVTWLGLLFLAAAVVRRAVRGAFRAWTLLGVFIAVAALGAAYGIVETFLLHNHVLSHPKGTADAGVTGTFFYRGNFCAFSAAALGVAVAATVAAFRRGRPLLAAGASMAAVVLASGLLLANSRAGLIVLVAGVLAGAIPQFRSARFRWGVVGLVVIGAAVVAAASGKVLERFSYLGDAEARGFLDVRVPAWQSTLELAGGRPLAGAGLGCYRRAIHLTQSDCIPDELIYAHSDPLNLLAEGGALGLLIGAALLGLGVAGAVSRARPQGDANPDLGAACIGGIGGMLGMILLDFPLQVPATGLMFVILLILPTTDSGPPEAGRKSMAATWAPVGMLLLVALALLPRFGVDRGAPRTLTPGERLAGSGAAMLRDRDYGGAIETLTAASRLQPFDAVTRHQLAAALFRARGPGDPACLRELEAAAHVGRGMANLLYHVGEMAYRGFFAEGRELAVRCFKEASALDHDLFWKAFRYFGGRDAEMAVLIVPERKWAYPRLARWHADRKEYEAAIEAYWKALDLGAGPELLHRIADLYLRQAAEELGRVQFAERGFEWPEK